MPPRLHMLAPFRVRSFRFQWPADLATAWALEMETLILGWYVLTETGSVVMLTAFGALQYLGTLISPMFGVGADRIGHRRLLMAMRATYAVLAATLAALALAGVLDIAIVFVVALLSGLIRPSDIGLRNALIGATMPAPLLMGALAVERSSSDAARMMGALTGAATVALLGIGFAYLVVTALYLTGLALMLGVAETAARRGGEAARALRTALLDLREGVAHVRETPALMAAMWLAFLVNLLAFPLTGGLLPHVAKEVYGMDQTGLGKLSASFSAGALLGSVVLSARGAALPAGRTMMIATLLWLSLLLVYGQLRQPGLGFVLLFVTGAVQSFCMVPMQVMLLRVCDARFRGRVMGLRVLAVYGLPLGLLAAGPLIAWQGFAATALVYASLALAFTIAIGVVWRRHLWPLDTPANAGHAS
jgi:predicted MFS family arabinose efflux permease